MADILNFTIVKGGDMLDKVLKTIVGSIILFGGIATFFYFPQVFVALVGLWVICAATLLGYWIGDMFFKHIMGE